MRINMVVFTGLHEIYMNTCCGDLNVPEFGGLGRVKSGGSGLGTSGLKLQGSDGTRRGGIQIKYEGT
jgi:hypothetical protein